MPTPIFTVDTAGIVNMNKFVGEYQKKLEGIPEILQKINKGMDTINVSIRLGTAALTEHHKALSGIHGTMEKIVGMSKSFSSAFSGAFSLVLGPIGLVGNMLGGVLRTMFSLPSIIRGGIISAASLIAPFAIGGHALNSMIAGLGASRHLANSLGVGIGEQRAFELTAGRFVSDPNSMLGTIRDLRGNPGGWPAFSQMGIANWQNMSAGDLGFAIIRAGKQAMEMGGGRFDYMKAHGFGAVSDESDWTTWKEMSDKEIAAMDERRKAIKRDTDLSKDVARNWEDVGLRFHTGWYAIQNALAKALLPMAPAFEKLSAAIVKCIEHFLTTANVEFAIKKLGDWLGALGTYLESKSFQRHIDEFDEALTGIRNVFWNFIDWMKRNFPEWSRSDTDIGPNRNLPTNWAGTTGAPPTAWENITKGAYDIHESVDTALNNWLNNVVGPYLGIPPSSTNAPSTVNTPQENLETHPPWQWPTAPSPVAPGGWGGPLWRPLMQLLFGRDAHAASLYGPNEFNPAFVQPASFYTGTGQQSPFSWGSLPGAPANTNGATYTDYSGPWFNVNRTGTIPSVGNIKAAGGGYRMYSSMADNVRDMADYIRTYPTRFHADTIRDIMNTYAPPSENDTERLIAEMEGYTGFKRNQHLNLNDPRVLANIVSGFMRQEGRYKSLTGQVTMPASQVEILITNQTAGSATVSASGLAASPGGVRI
jgi:hypothetical protein